MTIKEQNQKQQTHIAKENNKKKTEIMIKKTNKQKIRRSLRTMLMHNENANLH